MARWVALVAALTAVVAISGCSSGNDDYRQDIPAALDASNLGISDSSAGQSLSGFSYTLDVRGTYDAAEFRVEDFPELLTLILDNTSRTADRVNISLETDDGRRVDWELVREAYGLRDYGDETQLGMKEAREIAEQ